MTKQLQLFKDTLPRRPLACDDFTRGVYPTDKMQAMELRYVQVNGPSIMAWMPFDCDWPGAAYLWADCGVPAPTFTIESPESRHAHLLFGLGTPVDKRAGENPKALRYAAAIERALQVKLGADAAYSGLLVKTPGHPAWRTLEWADTLYGLSELADYCAPLPDARRKLPTVGLGRNVDAFNRGRLWAYSAIRKAGWPGLDRWTQLVHAQVEQLNQGYAEPLPQSEVRSIARSIARWTHQNFTPQAFAERQAELSALAATKHREQADARAQGFLAFMGTLPDGISLRAAARMHGTSIGTAHRWMRQG